MADHESPVERHIANQGNDPQQSPTSLPIAFAIRHTPAHPDDTIALAPEPGVGQSPHRQFGEYELLNEIARGGMGVVYKARQKKLNRVVALKMILAGELADEAAVRRFYTEAEAAGQLQHPGIVAVHEVGEYNGQHFFSMDYVEGQSLSALARDKPFTTEAAARCLKSVAEAIHYAHEHGVLHRDVKPANVIVDSDGRPRVTDFGLAKRMGDTSGQTCTHDIMGTPSYMSPEQASGRISDIGPPSDVYSLGAMLYELLTGRPPFRGETPLDTVRQVLERDPVSLRLLNPKTPRDLETICLKCLRREPAKRYTTAAELAADLGNWLESKPIVARPVGQTEKAWLWCKRRPTLVRMSLLLLVLLTGGTLAATLIVRERQNATRFEGLVGRLVSAEPNQLPEIVKELDTNPQLADTFLLPLLSANASTPVEKRSQLHARLARVSRDPSLIEPLVEELLTGKVTYVLPIRQLLKPSAAQQLTEEFRSLLRDEQANPQRRFRAALALADYVPASEAASWSEPDLQFVAGQLVSSNAEFQPLLRDALRPIHSRLLVDLQRIFEDPKATDPQRLSAANAFADYAGDVVARLTQMLAVATPEQYGVLYPIVAANLTPDTMEELGKIAATLPPAELGSVERVPFGQRRANAAVTLLRLGEHEKVLPVFEMTDDPEALTQFIFRCRPRGVGAAALLDCLQRVTEAPSDRYPKHTRYALLLALGEFTLEEIPKSRREALLKQLADWYHRDPSSGIHAAAGWLLRQWGQVDIARAVDQTPVPYAAGREWFTLAITVTPKPPPSPQDKAASREPEKEEIKPEPLPTKTFYYTFIVFPAGEYDIGSVPDEQDRKKDETRHSLNLTRPFALLNREITFEELIAFSPKYAGFMEELDTQRNDAGYANWYDSVGFCRWLGQQSGLSEHDQAYPTPEALDKARYPRDPNPAANWAPRDWPLELGRQGFRLPTEAEWEAASRAGARTAYGFGSDTGLLGRFGWFTENCGKHVHSPRELRPCSRGLFDVHGNLSEWTHDWYGRYGETAAVDPLGAKVGITRVGRGGSWGGDATFCRSAIRIFDHPARYSIGHGLRLALSPPGVVPEKRTDTKTDLNLGQQLRQNLAFKSPSSLFPKASASHTTGFDFDKAAKANDGIADFNPQSLNRWTAYLSTNPTDWLEIEFEQETDFSRVDLAIYDEGPKRGVQTPLHYTLEVWNGEAWREIQNQERLPEKPKGNDWNRIRFEKVTAKKVRVVLTHQENTKSGLVEIAIWP